jgi:aspartate 1-decarboxylase
LLKEIIVLLSSNFLIKSAIRNKKMNVTLLKAKIHQARITSSDLDYEGSLAIDRDLMDAVGIMPYEKILVVNATNGERLETYAICGERGSKIFCLNGAAARKGAKGDTITIMAFGSYSPEEAAKAVPSIIVLDSDNEITSRKGSAAK